MTRFWWVGAEVQPRLILLRDIPIVVLAVGIRRPKRALPSRQIRITQLQSALEEPLEQMAAHPHFCPRLRPVAKWVATAEAAEAVPAPEIPGQAAREEATGVTEHKGIIPVEKVKAVRRRNLGKPLALLILAAVEEAALLTLPMEAQQAAEKAEIQIHSPLAAPQIQAEALAAGILTPPVALRAAAAL